MKQPFSWYVVFSLKIDLTTAGAVLTNLRVGSEAGERFSFSEENNISSIVSRVSDLKLPIGFAFAYVLLDHPGTSNKKTCPDPPR